MKYYRKVIHISAEDSPNVKLGLAERAKGLEPSGRLVLEGVLSWDEYVKRLATWDEVRICIGIKGRFWEGKEVLMYPPQWLNRAEDVARSLTGRKRIARGIGIDPGEGVANTSWTATDELGLIEQRSRKTPDTSDIVGETIAFMNEHECHPERVCFDKGGGGHQIACQMRRMGYPVRTVGFGESILLQPQRHKRQHQQKVDNVEERYTYVNRRAQMYHALRLLIEPQVVDSSLFNRTEDDDWERDFNGAEGEVSFSQGGSTVNGFGIPAEMTELRRQLAKIPLLYDGEGRIYLPPKHRKEGQSKEVKTLVDVIGCSPDEADSAVLAVHAMQSRPVKATAGTI